MFAGIIRGLKKQSTDISNTDRPGMPSKYERKSEANYLRIRKLRIGITFLLTAAFLAVSTTDAQAFFLKWDSLYGTHEKDDTGSSMRNNIIYFKNDRVETGVPLEVEGAPKGSTFVWTITGADKTASSFTTTDNRYTPVDADLEKLITVTIEGMDGAVAAIYFSTLPVIYINNDTGYYGVSDDYSKAIMSMQGNAAFSSKDQFYSGDLQIKLRGRSTRYREKRPFNIKLDSKADLLGMGANKRWSLLANDIDHTLMRNKLLYDFSGAIGMDTYMKSEDVVVIFNNQYYGVYQLSEHINIGPDRVDIYDWESTAETAAKAIVKSREDGNLSKEDKDKAEDALEDAMCTDLSWITSPYTFSFDVDRDGTAETYTITDYVKFPEATGGVLVELDMGVHGGTEVSPMITAYAQPLFFNTPEYGITNEALFSYTKKYLQTFEYTLHSTDFTYHEKDKKFESVDVNDLEKNPGYKEAVFHAPEYEGKHYSELFDMDSLVENFLVCEFSMNFDSMRCSGYLYKDVDGLFHMGPEWDFDWAWGNPNMFQTYTNYPTSWQTTDEVLSFKTEQWNRGLIKDPYFLVQAYQKYKEIRGTILEDMIKNGGTIDTYRDYLKTAGAANDAKWGYTYAEYSSVGFGESVATMKTFISKRLAWFDQQFESPETLMNSLGAYKPSTELQIDNVDTETSPRYIKVTAVATNPDIAGIAFQVNGTHRYDAAVENGQAVCQIPVTDLVPEEGKLNVIEILAKDSAGTYILDSVEEGNYYNAKSNYTVFESSKSLIDSIAAMSSQAGQSVNPVLFITVIIAAGIVLAGATAFILLKARKRK